MKSNDLHTPESSGVNRQPEPSINSSCSPSTLPLLPSDWSLDGSENAGAQIQPGERTASLPGSFSFNTKEVEILEAVDRLNSWARTSAARHTAVGHVVYWLKNESIKWAASKGWASHRRIGVDTKCHGCGGTGRYIDSCGYEFNHCRACSNSGTAHLSFIETTILDRFRWHTPIRRAYDIVKSWIEAEQEQPVTDWLPNQPGRELPIHEAARLLCFIETEVPHGPYPHRYVHWEDDYGQAADDFATYRLYVGRTSPDQCNLCGATEPMVQSGFYTSTGRIEWSGHVCERCNTGDVFERLRNEGPHQLIEHPDIQEWIRWHPVPEPKRKVYQ